MAMKTIIHGNNYLGICDGISMVTSFIYSAYESRKQTFSNKPIKNRYDLEAASRTKDFYYLK